MDGNWNKWWMWLLAPVILLAVGMQRLRHWILHQRKKR